jgi:single stranded DNA-binding protein
MRVDVHPYEEAEGFQRLLDIPGYDVATLVEKSGKSASHIYARLSLLQLIPEVADAFTQERITASHANLIARIPQESQAAAFEQCWRKDWKDDEAHLLPAKFLSAWIQSNLYLALADAPFDREDPTLNPAAGACTTCPRRSGYNILIGRLGQNAEAKTAQNNREYVVLNIATQESWKNNKGDYETRTEWHRVFAWRNLSKFARTLQKGQLITLEGTLKYCEADEDVEGAGFKHRIAEVHATSMKRLSKIEATDDPTDGAGGE